ncbi:MAG: oligosaccharide flippase family protein [Gammaproteobacteria bacterium]|nr:oligosaccharide flippase family protein [Gammaproteobacteria bacterium]MDH5691597.1 oligosaccharide flippase family protein [Gammaproteobacteria bacterium]
MAQAIKTKITSGILWSVLMRWSMKFIGLISTIILARILVPEDFGLVAMATLVIGLIEEFSTVNISLLLIRVKGDDRSHNDTAWTVGILQSIFVAALLFLLAPFAADYFNDPRVVDVVYVLALTKIIVGLQNIGIILARKELNFALDYRFIIYRRLAIFFPVLILALVLGDYWAIVYGTLIGEVVGVILSYTMHSYRPRFCTVHLAEYVKFAIPMIPMAIAKLLNDKFDVIVVGGNTGTAQMGIYNIANELGSIFTKEVILPTTRGLFPNFTRLAENREQFISVFLLIVSATLVFCVPVVAGMWLAVDDLVYVLLGEKWLESTVYLKWLVVFGAVTSVVAIMSEHPLIALKMEHTVNKLMWLRLAILAACVLVGYELNGILGIAMGMAVSALINLPLITLIVSYLLKVSFFKLTSTAVIPVFSATIMFLVIHFLLDPLITDLHQFIRLILIAGTGGLVYVSILYGIWVLRKKPEGIEKIVSQKISGAIKRK